MGLVWTALDSDAVGGWAELVNLLAVADGTDEFYSEADLAEELTEHGVDPALDTFAVWDGTKLIAFGQLRVRTGLNEGRTRVGISAGVHPDRRGEGIGRELMDRLEARGLQLSTHRHPGVPIGMGCMGGIEGASVRPLLEHRGYRPVRYFASMERELPGEPLAQPAHPAQPYRDEHNEPLRIAHNDAFATHFGSAELSPDEWNDGIKSRTFRPDCSTVLIDDTGTVLAYVMSYCYVPNELYIGRVGTIQSARGHGYARACLLAALAAGVEGGYTEADLDVDSINPTGAGGLYESVGFHYHPTKTFAVYEKVLPPLQ